MRSARCCAPLARQRARTAQRDGARGCARARPAIGAADLALGVASAPASAAPDDALPAYLFDLPLPDALATVERAAILRALALANGNRAQAARQLGIGRQSLYARMASLGIERDD
jgi:DNA-binding NtrC family response regulator